jgi:hypothetical protein
MNLEIKFRAKSIHSNEWVYGNFIHSKRFEGCTNKYRIHDKDSGMESDINPETVGLFSGIIDRDKIEIYNGDIFKLGAERQLFEVRFEHGCFLAFRKDTQYGLIGELKMMFIKVVGNIYDNPELLKS